ncbi:MAG TPA: aminotransferase class IV [Chitinophagaceae bacterium]|nr:aminotransferase class IV [Chitinophagaceae bacterium]
MSYICVNGKILKAKNPVLYANNRGFRYSDGLFETMKVVNRKIPLGSYHFERLFNGLELLGIKLPGLVTDALLEAQILDLCRQNSTSELSRVRLTVYAGNGDLINKNDEAGYIIESDSLFKTRDIINNEGLVIGVCPDIRKSIDKLSNIKSLNFLPYTMGAKYASENGLDDSIILNSEERVADTTIANLFLINGNQIITPALAEGCVGGVMRRYLVEKMRDQEIDVKETRVTVSDVENADEIFLANAVRGIRWVGRMGEKEYQNKIGKDIFERFVKTIPGWFC